MQSLWRLVLLAILAPALGSCSDSDDGALAVAVIGSEEALLADGLRLNPAAQHLRAATASGLVARDPEGTLVPALAERWLITDGGLSYIFRLREAQWPDGSPFTAGDARRSLERSRAALQGTSLGVDLAPIEEIREMTSRVLELRLSTPMPDMLRLLAQPELAIRSDGWTMGQMALVDRSASPSGPEEGEEAPRLTTLRFRPPEERGLPVEEDWEEHVRDITIIALDGRTATQRFYNSEFDLVLGGDVGFLPLVNTGPLTRGTARIDPAIGLFGLQVRSDKGVLATDTLREAIAMAIDRRALFSRFSIGGWTPTTRVVAPGLPDDGGFIPERWTSESIEELRAIAGLRIAEVREGDEAARLTIAMGDGPGHELLLRELTEQLAIIGIALERAETADSADLVLIDRVARYANPRWFLNQFHCSLRRGLCNEEVDALVAQALAETDPAQRIVMMAEAEAILTLDNIYIPLGMPLRWSLARGSVDPFEANPWAFHPLPELALIPR